MVGIALASSLIVDELHWGILGNSERGFPKASLTRMVDPSETIIGKALNRVLIEMKDFGPGSRAWNVLPWLGANLDDKEVVKQCQAVHCQVSAALFLRGDVRLATPFYMMQCLISNTLDEDEVWATLTDIYGYCECCLGVFMRKFRKRFPTAALAAQPLAGPALFHTVNAQLAFTTASVECEHKEMKEEIRSSGCAPSRAIVARRTICRRLGKAHLDKGGTDVALPLGRRKRTQKLNGDECEQCAKRPRLEQLANNPAGSSGRNGGTSLEVRDPGSAIDVQYLLRWAGVKSAKMLYLNFKRAERKQQHGRMKKCEAQAFDRDLQKYWHEQPALRTRWADIIKRVQAAATRPSCADNPEDLSSAKSKSTVWPSTFCKPEADSGQALANSTARALQYKGPVCPDVLAEWRSARGYSSHGLALEMKDSSSFDITDAGMPKVSPKSARHVWGCAAMPQNACRRRLAEQQLLRNFTVVMLALRQWVDGRKEAVRESTEYLMFTATEKKNAKTRTVCTIVGLHDVMFSPKVQVYTRCQVQNMDCDVHGFLTWEGKAKHPAKPPFSMTLMDNHCRLCRFQKRPTFRSLFHETSDEVVKRLVERTSNTWRLTHLKVELVPSSGTLMLLQVLGFGAETQLVAPPGVKIPAADAFFDWVGMRESRQALHDEFSEQLDDVAAGLLAIDDADGDAGDFDGGQHVLFKDAVLDEHEEAQLEDPEDGYGTAALDDYDYGRGDESDDEVALGIAVPEEVGGPAQSVIEALDLLADDAELEPEPKEEVQLVAATADRDQPFSISPLGYVRCENLKPEGTLGHIGFFGKNKTKLYATCHLHSKCSVMCGSVLRKRTREDLAAWLMQGEILPDGVDTAARKAAGERHMQAWKDMR